MSERTCSIPECNGKVVGQGWCSLHWQRWRRHGDPLVKSRPKSKNRCSEPGCDGEVTTAEFCEPHREKRRRVAAREARPLIRTICARCGTHFTAEGRVRKYCTHSCYRAEMRVRSNARRREGRSVGRVTHCLWCGVDITHKRNCAKYCSHSCGNLADARDNAERLKAASRRWQQENRERTREYRRAYYQANRGRMDVAGREWREANPDVRRAIARKHYRKAARENPERFRLDSARRSARHRANAGGPCQVTQRDWHRLLVAYRHRCAYCGVSPNKPLEVEHVVPLARGGRHSVGNIVPACQRCNRSKNDRLLVEWRYNHRRTRAARSETRAAFSISAAKRGA